MGNLRIQNLRESLGKEAFELATRVFIDSSALHKALDVTLDEYQDYLRASFFEMINEGLSAVAIQENKVVGCMIVGDYHIQLQSSGSVDDKFAPLKSITGKLRQKFLEHQRTNAEDMVLIDMGAVSPLAGGKGIYQAMRKFACRHAATRGYSMVVGELSSTATQHVVINKLGHEIMSEVDIPTFEFKGQMPFRDVDNPKKYVLAMGDLGVG